MIHVEFRGNRLTFEVPIRDVTVDFTRLDEKAIMRSLGPEPQPGATVEVLPGLRVKVDAVARTPTGWRAMARWIP